MLDRRVSRLLTLPQLVAKPPSHGIPALAGVRIGFAVLQAFVEDLAVPFRDVN